MTKITRPNVSLITVRKPSMRMIPSFQSGYGSSTQEHFPPHQSWRVDNTSGKRNAEAQLKPTSEVL